MQNGKIGKVCIKAMKKDHIINDILSEIKSNSKVQEMTLVPVNSGTDQKRSRILLSLSTLPGLKKPRIGRIRYRRLAHLG